MLKPLSEVVMIVDQVCDGFDGALHWGFAISCCVGRLGLRAQLGHCQPVVFVRWSAIHGGSGI